MSAVVYPIRVLARLGVKDIISKSESVETTYAFNFLPVTNAAGSLNPEIPVGTSTNITWSFWPSDCQLTIYHLSRRDPGSSRPP